MKRSIAGGIAGVALIAALGAIQPASALDEKCADCVIKGVVEMAGWQPNPYTMDLEGSIVATITDPRGAIIPAVGTIESSIWSQSQIPLTAGQAIHTGGSYTKIRVTEVCRCTPRSFVFTYSHTRVVGNYAHWNISGFKADVAYQYGFVADYSLVSMVGGLTYVGTVVMDDTM